MTEPVTELILDRAPSAVVAIDESGSVTYWNASSERTFGLSREQAIGRPVAELIVPERLRDAHLAGFRRVIEQREAEVFDRRLATTAVRRDGTEFPVEITLFGFPDGRRWSFYGFVRDVSERHAHEREHDRLVEELRRALHGSERRFDAIVGSISDPVTIRDREHQLVYANQAAITMLGLDSNAQLRATPPDQIMSDYIVLDEQGNEVAMDDIPSVRIINGEDAEPLVIETVQRQTGAHRWQHLKAAPLLDEDGEIEATIMIIEDVTEQKRSQRQAAFLARASEILASSLDYEQTLKNVAQLAVPTIVDWCAVDLFDADGKRQPVAVAHSDPSRLELAERLRAYEPDRLNPDEGLGRVFQTGEPVLYPEITDELLERGAVDAQHLALLREIGFASAMIVPVRLGEKTLGAMTLVSAESKRPLDGDDLAVAQHVAGRAAVAIENARLYSERTRIAHTLQQSLLPERLPQIPGYELASIYTPAVEGSDVGGDFYDVWEVGDSWLMVIGDVTGKGIDAAVLTSLVRHTLRAVSEFETSPARLLTHVDRALKKQDVLSICTALCARLTASRVTLAVGGHPLPFHLSKEQIAAVGESGPLLGGLHDVEWSEFSLELGPGSSLIAYTDGVTDALRKDGIRYGQDRLLTTLEGCADCSATELVESLAQALGEFRTGGHADDTAALVLRRSRTSDAGDGRSQSEPAQVTNAG